MKMKLNLTILPPRKIENVRLCVNFSSLSCTAAVEGNVAAGRALLLTPSPPTPTPSIPPSPLHPCPRMFWNFYE